MNNDEILKQTIEKAMKNGYEVPEDFDLQHHRGLLQAEWQFYADGATHNMITYGFYYLVIFSHDFAKAFWGEEQISAMGRNKIAWKWELQQMVLEEEPLKYLEKFLT